MTKSVAMWGGARLGVSTTRLFVAVTLLATVSLTESAEILVGGSTGWTTGFNYDTWVTSQNIQFRVGDALVFSNPNQQVHTVGLLSDADSYQRCDIGAATNTTPVASGAKFTLVIPATLKGQTLYAVCTIPGHCTDMQKMHGTVLAALGDSSAPPPAPSAAPSGGPSTSGSEYPSDADMNRYICWTTAVLLIAACFWNSG